MSTPNQLKRQRAPVPSGEHMPRKARKIRVGAGLVRISCLLEADIAAEIDKEAHRMTAEDSERRTASRTDALRSLVIHGLAAKRDIKLERK